MSDPSIPPILTYLGLGPAKVEETGEAQYKDILLHGAWPKKVATVRKLEHMHEQAPIALLLLALQDEHAAVRTAAVRALGLMGEQAPMEPLINALEDQVWHVRAAAAVALGKQSPRAPVEPLLTAMHDEDESVREAATWAAGTLGQHAPLDALRAALNDPASSVRETAARALQSLPAHAAQETLPTTSGKQSEMEHRASKRTGAEQITSTGPLTPHWTERNTGPVVNPLPIPQEAADLDHSTSPQEFPAQQRDQEREDTPEAVPHRARKSEALPVLAPENARGHLHSEEQPTRRSIGRIVSFRGKRLIEQGLAVAAIIAIAFAWFAFNASQHGSGSGQGQLTASTALHFSNPNGAVTSVVWAPPSSKGGAQQVAFADTSGYVQILDLTSKRAIAAYGPFHQILSLAWSANGLSIATLNPDGTLQLLRGGDNTPLLSIGQVGTAPLTTWSPDGKRIAVGINKGKHSVVQVWDLTTRSLTTTHPSQFGTITAIAWSKDGTNMATAYDDGKVRIIEVWNTTKGTQVKSPTPIPYVPVPFRVLDMAWAPDGVHLAYVLTDGEVRVWNSTTYNHQLFSIETTKNTTSQIANAALAWSPNGKVLVSSTMSSAIIIWDTNTGTPLSTYKEHQAVVEGIAWSPDGKNIASVSQNGEVFVWQEKYGTDRA